MPKDKRRQSLYVFSIVHLRLLSSQGREASACGLVSRTYFFPTLSMEPWPLDWENVRPFIERFNNLRRLPTTRELEDEVRKWNRLTVEEIRAQYQDVL